MGRKSKELTGKRFGKLIATSKTNNRKHGSIVWECQCDCGNLTKVTAQHLLANDTKSCGCWRREAPKITKRTHGDTRDGKRTKLYQVWGSMIQRCTNPNRDKYKWYGGRGIRVCAEWLDSYQAFKDWALSHGYADNLTIDRTNNDGNYEPKNCHWVTKLDNINKQKEDQQIRNMQIFLLGIRLGRLLGTKQV